MVRSLRSALRTALRLMGLEVYRRGKDPRSLLDMNNLDEHTLSIFREVKSISATSLHRVDALVGAIRYLEAGDVPGAFVECGVWRGGSVVAMIRALQSLGSAERDIYLFDTFCGMSQLPGYSEHDISFRGEKADDLFNSPGSEKKAEYWSVSLEMVRKTVMSTSYPPDKLHFIQGMVEETLPQRAPHEIALLRLDTDFYQSTKHEMVHLYPRLVKGGVLLVDDYGHWRGAKKAVDEYLAENNEASILLNRIDYSGRIGVKIR